MVERVAPQLTQGKPVTVRKGHFGQGNARASQVAAAVIATTETASQINS